jgi:syntaxin 5
MSFLQSRAEGVEHVERQLAELSTVFERLSMLVHEHELMLERIDSNTDAALLHIEQSKVEVAKYHESVSSSRTLAIKVFMIFVVFFAFYVVFLV